MANRCPDCNKFVATDVEVTSTEVDDLDPECGIVMLHLEVSRNCAECGSEVSSGTVELELEVADAVWAKALKATEFEPV